MNESLKLTKTPEEKKICIISDSVPTDIVYLIIPLEGPTRRVAVQNVSMYIREHCSFLHKDFSVTKKDPKSNYTELQGIMFALFNKENL